MAASLMVRAARHDHWSGAFFGLIAASLVGFAFAPWPLQVKSMAVVHGLCAQQPSHSFWFGAERLPFDARMTGIYGGFLLTQLGLLARRRLYRAGIPSLLVVGLLALFVLALAADGVDSLLAGLGLQALYPPSNAVRYVTGALTGTTLALFLWLLLALTLWRDSDRDARPIVGGIVDLVGLMLPASVFGLLAASGWSWLYAPITLLLLLAAILALFELALPFVQVARGRANAAERVRQLLGPATLALFVAFGMLAMTSGSRFLLEAALHLPALQ